MYYAVRSALPDHRRDDLAAALVTCVRHDEIAQHPASHGESSELSTVQTELQSSQPQFKDGSVYRQNRPAERDANCTPGQKLTLVTPAHQTRRPDSSLRSGTSFRLPCEGPAEGQELRAAVCDGQAVMPMFVQWEDS